jgi:hypothetical protein
VFLEGTFTYMNIPLKKWRVLTPILHLLRGKIPCPSTPLI